MPAELLPEIKELHAAYLSVNENSVHPDFLTEAQAILKGTGQNVNLAFEVARNIALLAKIPNEVIKGLTQEEWAAISDSTAHNTTKRAYVDKIADQLDLMLQHTREEPPFPPRRDKKTRSEPPKGF